jgi:hypothetical protein
VIHYAEMIRQSTNPWDPFHVYSSFDYSLLNLNIDHRCFIIYSVLVHSLIPQVASTIQILRGDQEFEGKFRFDRELRNSLSGIAILCFVVHISDDSF